MGLPQNRQYHLGKDVPDVARAAEGIGYDSVWVYERALFPEPRTQPLYGVPGLPRPDAYRGVAEPLVTLTRIPDQGDEPAARAGVVGNFSIPGFAPEFV